MSSNNLSTNLSRTLNLFFFGQRANPRLPTRLRAERDVSNEVPIVPRGIYKLTKFLIETLASNNGYETIEKLRCYHAANTGLDIPKRDLSELLKIAVSFYTEDSDLAKERAGYYGRYKLPEFKISPQEIDQLIQAIVDEINCNARFSMRFRMNLLQYAKTQGGGLIDVALVTPLTTTGITDPNLIAIRKLNLLSSEYRVHLESVALQLVRALPREVAKNEYLSARKDDDLWWDSSPLRPIINLAALNRNTDTLPNQLKLVLDKLNAINQFEEKLYARDDEGKLLPATERLSAAKQFYLDENFQSVIASHRDSPGKQFLKACLFVLKRAGIGIVFSSVVWQQKPFATSYGQHFLKNAVTFFDQVPVGVDNGKDKGKEKEKEKENSI